MVIGKMVLTRIIGVLIISLMLAAPLGLLVPTATAQSVPQAPPTPPPTELMARNLKIYQVMINRTLSMINVSIIPPELREKAEFILSLNVSEIKDNFELLKEYLAEAREVLKELVGLLREIGVTFNATMAEAVQLRIMIKTMVRLAERTGNETLVKMAHKALELVKEGKFREARMLMKLIRMRIEAMRTARACEHLEGVILRMLNTTGNITTIGKEKAVEAILRSLHGLDNAIKVLTRVRAKLIAVNASENAVLAITRVINTLEQTKNVMLSVVSIVRTMPIHEIREKMREAALSTLTTRLAEEISKLRNETQELIDKSDMLKENITQYNLEQFRPVIYRADQFINKTLTLLAAAETALNENKTLEALKLVSRAKAYFKVAEGILEHVEEAIEKVLEARMEHEERIQEMVEKLNETITDVREEISELLVKLDELQSKAEELNATEVIEYITKVKTILQNIDNALAEAQELLNEGNYTMAFQKVRELIMRVKGIELAVDKIEAILKSIEEMQEKLGKTMPWHG